MPFEKVTKDNYKNYIEVSQSFRALRRAQRGAERQTDSCGRRRCSVRRHSRPCARRASIPNADYLLEVDNVRKEFPGVVALDNVNLRVRRGTVHALMGENGAGKSTLMKIIAGVYQPDTGEIRLKGNQIKIATPLDALEAGIAMIHQELNLMPYHDGRREHLDPPRAAALRLRRPSRAQPPHPRLVRPARRSTSTRRRRCATTRSPTAR